MNTDGGEKTHKKPNDNNHGVDIDSKSEEEPEVEAHHKPRTAEQKEHQTPYAGTPARRFSEHPATTSRKLRLLLKLPLTS